MGGVIGLDHISARTILRDHGLDAACDLGPANLTHILTAIETGRLEGELERRAAQNE